jgi:hypothetical protein
LEIEFGGVNRPVPLMTTLLILILSYRGGRDARPCRSILHNFALTKGNLEPK